MDTALGVRARGLGVHLLSAGALAAVDRASDLDQLGEQLVRAGYPGLAEGVSAGAIDRAAAHRGAIDLVLLTRWCRGRAGAVELLVDEVDAANLRVMVRGVAGHVAAHRRLAAVAPTPSLPAAELDQLAAATNIAELVDVLDAAAHPYAGAVRRGITEGPVDVLAIEAAIVRLFAGRASAMARDRAARVFVAQHVDLFDATAALQVAERGGELDLDDALVGLGPRAAAARTAARSSLAVARERLARAFARTPVAEPLRAGATRGFEDAALDWQLATQEALRRRDPIGSAAVLWLALARRREHRHVRRAAWRLALGGQW